MTFLNILTTVGVASIILGLLYIGRKLQVLDDLQITTDKIKVNIKVISDFLAQTNTEFNHSELQVYSPLKLTSDGKQLIKQIGFDTILKEHRAEFFQCIDQEEPKLKYDVEAAAIKSVSILTDQDYMSPLKIFFYNNPERNLQNTGPTLGIYIRDKYLAEHPEISE